METAEAYQTVRGRMLDLASVADPATPVPTCPGWTIKELLSHVTGVAADVLNGNIAEAGTDPWVAAQVAARADHSFEEVTGEWTEAAKLWTQLGCPYDAALTLSASTDESALRAALASFTDLGATAASRIVRQKLRGLGVRSIPAGPRSMTRTHPFGLTRREREVLELICAGCTDAEIAAKLFISVKTASHHVSAILAKLEAPNRTLAAHRANQLGLTV